MLGDRLRIARDKKGFSQIEVKQRININNKTLSGYEKGVSEPDTKTLRLLADLYEVTTDWLIGKSDDPELTEEEAFEVFKNSPELERWYKELPKNKEEDLQRLKRLWEAFKEDD